VGVWGVCVCVFVCVCVCVAIHGVAFPLFIDMRVAMLIFPSSCKQL
jgi:hypothetical protein